MESHSLNDISLYLRGIFNLHVALCTSCLLSLLRVFFSSSALLEMSALMSHFRSIGGSLGLIKCTV